MDSQSEFRAALLDASIPVPDGLKDGQGRPAGNRFGVYRNNVVVALTDALATGFPTIAKLLGSQNFNNIAGLYLRQNPPQSPLMMHYGAPFPQFLADFPPLAHLPYLKDVARLELALRHSYHAADSTPADATILQSLDEDALMASTMALAPSVRLIRSQFPHVAIWEFNMIDGAPKPAAVAQDALILRPEFDPTPHALPQGGAEFVETLGAGHSFGDAMTAATTLTQDFDLGATLGLLFGNGAITQINTKD